MSVTRPNARLSLLIACLLAVGGLWKYNFEKSADQHPRLPTRLESEDYVASPVDNGSSPSSDPVTGQRYSTATSTPEMVYVLPDSLDSDSDQLVVVGDIDRKADDSKLVGASEIEAQLSGAIMESVSPRETESLEVVPDQSSQSLDPNTEQPLFTSDDLAILEAQGSTDLLDRARNNPGVRSGDAPLIPDRSDTSSEQKASSTPAQEGSDESDQERERVSGQSRGYQLLHLMQPRARPAVEAHIQAMLNAEINELFLGVLTDGSFSKDFSYLQSVIQRLSSDNRILTLVLYMTNGPAMRRFDETPINETFTRTDPLEFRDLIRFDPDTRAEFQALAREILPTFQLNSALNPNNKNFAVVMLEDNLRADSYRAMRDLAAQVFGNQAQFIRNPCPGCYQGNDVFSFGDPIETHEPNDVFTLDGRNSFTLDGVGFYYPGEEPRGLSLEQVSIVFNASLNRGLLYVGLWRRQRQGLQDGALVHPRERVYEMPTPEQLATEIEFLRQGLTPINTQISQGVL